MLKEVDLILYLHLVLLLHIIHNGVELIRVWGKKMLMLNNMLNLMYVDYKMYIMGKLEVLLVRLNILLGMVRLDMVLIKVKLLF